MSTVYRNSKQTGELDKNSDADVASMMQNEILSDALLWQRS